MLNILHSVSICKFSQYNYCNDCDENARKIMKSGEICGIIKFQDKTNIKSLSFKLKFTSPKLGEDEEDERVKKYDWFWSR